MSEAAVLMQRPAHVPEAAVYDFDMFLDPALLTDPHERVRELLRDAPPVFWTPHNGGHWVATSHEAIFRVSREHETFSSSMFTPAQKAAMMAAMPAGMPRIPQSTPITMDPPEHTKYRAPLQSAFSPKTAMGLKGEIVALANQLIDAVIDQGHCDFIPTIAEPLPVQVFLKMMGLPVERLAEFRAMVHEVLAPRESGMAEQGMRLRKVADAMLEVIEARRVEPKDDIISLLWRTEIDGQPMTLELMEDYAVLLFIAGLDTVINGIGFGVRHLAENPDFQAELRANPKLIPDAAEELLRRYTFTIPMRHLAKDTELAGWTLKTGEWVAIYLPGADLDEREFESPEKFDLNRENKVHIAFGAGAHRCLGSHLARVELQTIYTLLLERLPMFRLDPDKPVKFHAGNIIAIDSLPLRWD